MERGNARRHQQNQPVDRVKGQVYIEETKGYGETRGGDDACKGEASIDKEERKRETEEEGDAGGKSMLRLRCTKPKAWQAWEGPSIISHYCQDLVVFRHRFISMLLLCGKHGCGSKKHDGDDNSLLKVAVWVC